jgi:hypothetical protein
MTSSEIPDCPRCGPGAESVDLPTGSAPRVRVLDRTPSGEDVWVCRTCHERVYPAADVRAPLDVFKTPKPATAIAATPSLFDV